MPNLSSSARCTPPPPPPPPPIPAGLPEVERLRLELAHAEQRVAELEAAPHGYEACRHQAWLRSLPVRHGRCAGYQRVVQLGWGKSGTTTIKNCMPPRP